jgi:DNA-binding XRE family transcriptional regulator
MPIPYTSKGWETRFGKFLKSYGTHKLAKELGIYPSTIYHWMAGVHYPRTETAQKIVIAAKSIRFRLTLSDVYEGQHELVAEVNQ